jgi:microcystin degradation protein MlrC
VLADVSDNPGGGSPGDGTHLLRAMLDAGLADACFGFIYDPDTALQAHVAGAGVEIDVRLGARGDAGYGDPIVARATVRCLTDGRFRATNPMLGGRLIDLGPSARLRIGTLDVIVASRRTQTFDPELFLLHGIDVRRCAIVALKSSHHYRAGFRELAGEIIGVDTGGATSPRVSALRHERIRRPMWPLDAAAGA